MKKLTARKPSSDGICSAGARGTRGEAGDLTSEDASGTSGAIEGTLPMPADVIMLRTQSSPPLRPVPRLNQRRVNVRRFRRHTSGGEPGLYLLPAVLPHARPQRGIAEEEREVRRKRSSIAVHGEQSAFPVFNDLGCSAVVHRDHWFLHRHRFKEHQSEWLFTRRQCKDVTRRHQRRHVGALARKDDVGGHAKIRREHFELGSEAGTHGLPIVAADDEQLHVGEFLADRRKRANHIVLPLAAEETRRARDHGGAGRNAESLPHGCGVEAVLPAWQIDRIQHGVGLLALVAIVDQRADDEVRHPDERVYLAHRPAQRSAHPVGALEVRMDD
jgi:hypothetical protein